MVLMWGTSQLDVELRVSDGRIVLAWVGPWQNGHIAHLTYPACTFTSVDSQHAG